MEDRELVRRLIAQDGAAQRYFFDTYRDKLYRASCYILGYRDPDAEDVVQETILAALRKVHEFEFRGSLYHWLYRICMYQCYERIRKRKRMLSSQHEDLEIYSQGESVKRQAEESGTRDRNAALEVVKAQKLLLGEPCKGLLVLRDEQDSSYAEIAEKLRVPIGTVMSRLARCRDTLKKMVLRAMGEEEK